MSDPWKPCDIRGVFPTEVSATLARGVGSAVGSMLSVGSRVLVAGDFRISTPEIKSALAEGLQSAGAAIVDAGQIPTPVAHFAHRTLRTRAVLIVTASHNPANYNGIKIMTGKLPPTPEDLVELRQAVARADFRRAAGSYERVDPLPLYKKWIIKRWIHLRHAAPRSIALDPGGGAWGVTGPEVFASLGFRVAQVYAGIDGTFPHRSPDCARPAHLSGLRREVKREGAALGIAWDGDGDRVAFVDETGSCVSTDEVSALLIQHLLTGHDRERVVYDVKLSDIVPRAIREARGAPIIERSGHAFAKRRMIEQDCLLGCEASGHYFFRELKGGDDGLFAALLMVELIGRRGPLGKLREGLGAFFVTPDLRLPAAVLPYREIVRRLRSAFLGAEESNLDGLRLITTKGSILMRESVTEPVITMRLEGYNREALDSLLETCAEACPEIASEITNQIAVEED